MLAVASRSCLRGCIAWPRTAPLSRRRATGGGRSAPIANGPGPVVGKAGQWKGDVGYRAERPWIEATALPPVRKRQHGPDHPGQIRGVCAVQIDVRVGHPGPRSVGKPVVQHQIAAGPASAGSSQQDAGIIVEREIRRDSVGRRGICAGQGQGNHGFPCRRRRVLVERKNRPAGLGQDRCRCLVHVRHGAL